MSFISSFCYQQTFYRLKIFCVLFCEKLGNCSGYTLSCQVLNIGFLMIFGLYPSNPIGHKENNL